MRLNLPVTQHNYDYPADELLVSTTNLKGEITHCKRRRCWASRCM